MNNFSENIGTKVDPFSDKVLGEWKYNKKKTDKKTIWHERKATINLNETYAQDYCKPENGEKVKVFGELTLIEQKAMDIETSSISTFRQIELTPNSKIKEIIK